MAPKNMALSADSYSSSSSSSSSLLLSETPVAKSLFCTHAHTYMHTPSFFPLLRSSHPHQLAWRWPGGAVVSTVDSHLQGSGFKSCSISIELIIIRQSCVVLQVSVAQCLHLQTL